MGNPFTATSVSSYNANPPADDGSQVASNLVAWATIKTKLPDPIKSAFDTSETNTNNAFAKIIGGGGFTSTGTNYTVLAADQGKFVKATASAITITTPDATVVGSPFVFVVLNNSTGSITVAGNNPGVQQNLDGVTSVTLAAGAGLLINTDGTNWFTGGQQGIPIGKQLQYGDIINGTIVESNGSNATTFSLKTLAGNDPSATDPVLVCFRNPTFATGNYIFRSVAAATSITISAGSTMGTSNSVPFRIWLVLFDDAGTVRLGAINCVSNKSIYPLATSFIASSTAEGGAGAADSAFTFYTGTAVTSKSYVVLGFASYESGVSTAGNWNVNPNLQLFGPGVPLPGSVVQTSFFSTTTAQTTTAGPTATNLTTTLSMTSAANLIRGFAVGSLNVNLKANVTAYLARGGTQISNTASHHWADGSSTTNDAGSTATMLAIDAPGVSSSQTYQVYITTTAGTATFPLSTQTATMEIQELMA